MVLHFSLSDFIVNLQCLSAVNDFMIQVVMGYSYGLIVVYFFSCSFHLLYARVYL